MSGEAPTPQRRVRTGCLTCRARRRKCDETHPICRNCSSKKLVCRYGQNFTFVNTPWARTKREQRRSKQRASGNPIVPNTPVAAVEMPASDERETMMAIPSRNLTQDEEVDSPENEVFASYEQAERSHNDSYDVEQGAPWDLVDLGLSKDQNAETIGVVQTLTSDQPAARSPPTPPLTRSSLRQAHLPKNQDQYELDILHYYRYNIATILDLVPSRAYYGVDLMLAGKESSCVYNAILAMSSCHRAATSEACRDLDLATKTRSVEQSSVTGQAYSLLEISTRCLMMGFCITISEPPHAWLQRLHPLISGTSKESITREDRSMLARIVLAAIVIAPYETSRDISRWFLDDSLSMFESNMTERQQQQNIQKQLALLAKSCRFLPGITPDDHDRLQAWRSCWEQLGQWYANRTTDMQEIFRSSDDLNDPSSNTRIFPLIIFASTNAVIANVLYHLAAIILLQNKPRHVNADSRSGPSSSHVSHAQKLIGIVDAASSIGFWDPVVVVAVVHAARRLSHHEQCRATAKLLEKLMGASGMKLACHIDESLSLADE